MIFSSQCLEYRYFPLSFLCQVLVRNKIVSVEQKDRLTTGICVVISMRETSKFSAIAHVVIHNILSQCILPVSSELLGRILQWMDSWIMIFLETFHDLNYTAFTHPFNSLHTEVHNCGSSFDNEIFRFLFRCKQENLTDFWSRNSSPFQNQKGYGTLFFHWI